MNAGHKKQGIVRPGQKKPYKKASLDEIEERIAEVEMMLGRHARKGQIHRFIKDKYGVEWRTVDIYIARARVNLLERLRQTKENHRCQSLALYEEILLTGNPREKILAQERIDKLLGLEAPRSIAVGGIEGSAPIKIADERKYDPRKLDVTKLKNLKSILKDAKVQTEAAP